MPKPVKGRRDHCRAGRGGVGMWVGVAQRSQAGGRGVGSGEVRHGDR